MYTRYFEVLDTYKSELSLWLAHMDYFAEWLFYCSALGLHPSTPVQVECVQQHRLMIPVFPELCSSLVSQSSLILVLGTSPLPVSYILSAPAPAYYFTSLPRAPPWESARMWQDHTGKAQRFPITSLKLPQPQSLATSFPHPASGGHASSPCSIG